MRLRQLNVERMPGFTRRGFSIAGLSMGINVIWGPNGSGKTTACLAIRHLLWPNHCPDPTRIVLSSIWTSDNQDREICLEGSTYRADPALPLGEIQKIQPHLYTITIDDLFQANDEEFAAAIMREIRGGYDLKSLQEALTVAPKLGENENKNLLKRQEELASEIRRQEAIYEKEQTLPPLEEKIRAAQAASKSLGLVRAALAIKEREEEYDEVIKKIASFPSGIEHVRAEDRKRLIELQAQRRDLQKEIALLPRHSQLDGDPDLGLALIQEIRLLDTKIDSLKQARAEAQQQRLFYCRDLSIPPEKLEKIDLSGIESVLPGIVKLYECRLRLKEYETKLAMVTGGQGTSLFDINRFFTLPSACSLFGMIAATINAFVFTPLPIAIGAAIVTCIVAVSIAFRVENNKEKIEELQLLLNGTQNEAELIQHEIGSYLGKTQIDKFPDFSLLGSFLQQLKLAQDYWITEKKKEALLQPLLEEREELARRIETLLGGKFALVIEMENALAVSRKRLQETDKRDRLTREMSLLDVQLTELLSRCGCQKEDDLFTRHTQLPAYLQAVEKKAKLEGNLSELKRQVALSPELVGEDRAALEQRKKSLEEQEGSYRSTIEEKTGIEKDIEIAKLSRDLEEKRQALQTAEDSLETKKAEFRAKVLGIFLLEEIEESFKKETRPEALKNADAYFQRFTKNTYAIHGLGEDAGKACFLAFDAQNNTVKKHNELSRGTRLQLLLAIRLGFIAALEKQAKMLPLILDEAATHADDERWDAIALVLSEEAKAGRQILYFTCQRFVREAWKDASFHDLVKGQEHVPFVVHTAQTLVPAPIENEAISAYCQRIGLPGIDFFQPVTAQSIGHFLETSEELHSLLQAGLTTYGQVLNMHKAQSLQSFLKPQAAASAIAKGTLLQEFLEIYRIGRPPLVERGDLEDALQRNIISETFFPSVCELVQEKNGRGDQILEALNAKRVKGFRTNKIEELRVSLLQRGKIDTRVPLAPEELRTAFWQAYPAHADALSKKEAVAFLDNLLHVTV